MPNQSPTPSPIVPSPSDGQANADRPLASDRAEREANVPLRPHPLSNDLTEESLPPLSTREKATQRTGIGVGQRRMIYVIGGILLSFAVVAVIGATVLSGERWQLQLLGVGVAILLVVIFGAPVLLAAGTKVAQDEAVRESKTEPVERRSATPTAESGSTGRATSS